MMPAADATLHVRSAAVVVDGEQTAAGVQLRRGARGWVVEAIGAPTSDAVDLGAAWILPAPLDLHVHGAGGIVVPPGGSVEAIDAALDAAMSAWRWGTHPLTGTAPYEWVATLPIPQTPPVDPVQHVQDAARTIAEAGASGCIGIRIEGLFLNVDRAGVWPPETFRLPDVALLHELIDAARVGGSELLVIDVAPELPGALELIAAARAAGVVASLAHSDASWDEARAAIDAGATLATHTWNAMRAVTHRDPGIVSAVLADPRVTCELICDGVHLHPGTIALSTAASGRGGWIAVSDASPFAGSAPGAYEWAGTTVHHDGVALRDHEGRLAGSASLLTAAPDVLAASGVELLDALLAIGADPRRVLDPGRSRGLQVGDPVWIVDHANSDAAGHAR